MKKVGYIFDNYEKKPRGINRTIDNTIRSIISVKSEYEFYALEKNYLNFPKMQELGVIDTKDEILRGKILTMSCYRKDIDIIHSFLKPFSHVDYKCRKILLIHDLIPLVKPEFAPVKGIDEWYNVEIRKSAEMADCIITNSEYTKKDVVEYFNISEEKIKPIYFGLDHNIFFQSKMETDIKNRFFIKNEYILAVTAADKNKNLIGLIEAFEVFKDLHKESQLQLVLVGGSGSQTNEVTTKVKNSKYIKDIILTGYVSDKDLADLYAEALLFACISFYEGFGLPILEAMSAGKAVISSNTTSMPEVGGEAVAYCNPYEKDSVVAAIEKVVLDGNYRMELEKKAIIQAKKFSYDDTASQILNIYKELSNN